VIEIASCVDWRSHGCVNVRPRNSFRAGAHRAGRAVRFDVSNAATASQGMPAPARMAAKPLASEEPDPAGGVRWRLPPPGCASYHLT